MCGNETGQATVVKKHKHHIMVWFKSGDYTQCKIQHGMEDPSGSLKLKDLINLLARDGC